LLSQDPDFSREWEDKLDLLRCGGAADLIVAYDKDFSLGRAGLCRLVFEPLEIVDELAKLGY